MYWPITSSSIALCFLILAGIAYFITAWRTLCITLGSMEIVLVLVLTLYVICLFILAACVFGIIFQETHRIIATIDNFLDI